MRNFLHILATLKIGDRIVVPKSAWEMVQHHAIFIGVKNGRYQFIENKDGIGVRIVYAETFFIGVDKITRIARFIPKQGYQRNELVKYALSKLGKSYHLLKYNCEHFANEVQNRVVKSKQADRGLGFALLGLVAVVIASSGSSNRKRQ